MEANHQGEFQADVPYMRGQPPGISASARCE
jgi:hypothetical protein